MSSLPLWDYGLIGNQESVVLVSRQGSVDWCCLPYVDSPSHFSALLDESNGGRFQLLPTGDFHSEQRYGSRTNVLETQFETPTGRAILTDWMPMADESVHEPTLCRRIQMVDGEIDWIMRCNPAFNYASEKAQAERYRQGVLFRGVSPTDLALLRSTVPLTIPLDNASAVSQFKLLAGQEASFSWSWGRRARKSAFDSPTSTEEYWRNWAHRCPEGGCLFRGPWHDLVTRSGLVTKLMITHFSGSLAESATTSVPTLAGGSKNWDYRYAWIRNAAFSYQALQALGNTQEAQGLFQWIADIVIRDGADLLQPVYTLDGGRYLPERELGSLAGYAGSRPVRVGNLAARQFQLDIFGHALLITELHYQSTGTLPDDLWPRLWEIAEMICQAWRRPDRGPWEVRSKPEHFVASKALCWSALDRIIRIAERVGHHIPNRWREERQILHKATCDQGYDAEIGSFIRAFGERDLDASVLILPMIGFLPWSDDRIQSTLNVIQAELSEGVLLHRSKSRGGLPESDGLHLLSSFWFVSCLALSGRWDEASDRLAELCSYATPLGLFAEQLDLHTGHPAGNFPSSSAHLALINAALAIGLARARRTPPFPLVGGVPGSQNQAA